MVRQGYCMTNVETAELFRLMQYARLKLPDGKFKTMAGKWWEKLESALGLGGYRHEPDARDFN